MTSDFLSFDAIDTNNGVWVYLTVCVCVRAYVWGSLVLGGGGISCSFSIDLLAFHSGGL